MVLFLKQIYKNFKQLWPKYDKRVKGIIRHKSIRKTRASKQKSRISEIMLKVGLVVYNSGVFTAIKKKIEDIIIAIVFKYIINKFNKYLQIDENPEYPM